MTNHPAVAISKTTATRQVTVRVYTVDCACGMQKTTTGTRAEATQLRRNHLEWHERGDTGPVWGGDKIRPDVPDEDDCRVCGARMHRFQPGDWPYVDDNDRPHSLDGGPGHISRERWRAADEFLVYLGRKAKANGETP